MFGNLFKSTSEKEKLERAYRKKLEEAHRVGHSNRANGDKLQAEAEEILNKIKELEK